MEMLQEFGNSNSGRARLWDTALKFLFPVLQITSPDHLERVVRKPIRYVTIHFQDRSGAASLRCKNRAEISDPFVNRSSIRYGYCVGAQAIRYSVDIALDWRWIKEVDCG